MMRTSAFLLVFILGAALPGAARAASFPMCDSPPCRLEELQQLERGVIKHLLHAQQARFEAAARGEHDLAQQYDRRFNRARAHRMAVRQAMEQPQD